MSLLCDPDDIIFFMKTDIFINDMIAGAEHSKRNLWLYTFVKATRYENYVN